MNTDLIKSYARQYFKFGWNLVPLFAYSKNPATGNPYMPFYWQDPKTKSNSLVEKAGWFKKQGWWPLSQRRQTAEEIKTWIDNPELTGLGVITGKISNILVIDEDSYKEGGKTFNLETPLIALSANGGFHHYFKFNENINTTGLQKGVFVEIKAEGGFIVLPPTEIYKKDKTIGKYTWKKENLKNISDLPTISEADLINLSVKKEAQKIILSDFTEVGLGEQHNSLRTLTNSLLAKHDPKDWEQFVFPIIREKAAQYDPPHPEYRVEKMIQDCSDFILRKKNEKNLPQSISKVVQKRLAEKELEKDAPSTGYPDLDKILGGFIPGHVYCFSGLTNCIEENSLIDCSIVGKESNTKPVKIKNLFRYFHEGQSILVNSIDENTNKIIKNNITDIIYSGYQECFSVVTDDLIRNEITTTAEHMFYVGNGRYKKLQDLKVDDDIFMRSVHPKKLETKKKLKYKEVLVKYHPNNKCKIVNNKTYFRLKFAYLVYEAKLNKMSVNEYRHLLNNYNGENILTIDKDHEIHHIDFNSENDNINNLFLTNRKDHAHHHMVHRNQQQDLNRFGVKRKIISITPVGKKHTYDIKCQSPYHSFVANGYILHNCGKTSAVCNLAVRVAEQDKRVLYFALEPDNNIVDYLASAQSGKKFKELNSTDFSNLSQNIEVYTKDQISTLPDMVNALKKLPRYDLIIIDHLGYFIQGEAKSGTFQEQENALKKLVTLAQQQRSAVAFIVHMRKKTGYVKKNKAGEMSIPSIDELKGSSALSQDSTDVIFITREVDSDGITQGNNGRMIVVKTKSGKNGAIEIYFVDDSAKIIGPEEMATRMF